MANVKHPKSNAEVKHPKSNTKNGLLQRNQICTLCVQNYAKSTVPAFDGKRPPLLAIRKLADRKSDRLKNPSLFALGTHLSFHRFRCRILTHSPDRKIIELLASLEGSREPSRL